MLGPKALPLVGPPAAQLMSGHSQPADCTAFDWASELRRAELGLGVAAAGIPSPLQCCPGSLKMFTLIMTCGKAAAPPLI